MKRFDVILLHKKWFWGISHSLLIFTLGMLLFPGSVEGAMQIFTAASNGPLELTWRGEKLISADNITISENNFFDTPSGYRAETILGAMVQNLWINADESQPVPVRREVAIEKNVTEIAVQFEIPPFFMNEYALYKIRIPLAALAGFSYKGLANRDLDVVSGVIPSESKDAETMLGNFAFLALEKGNRRIVFDFNPSGPSAFNRYGPVQLVGRWYVHLSNGFLEMNFPGGSKSVCGGLSNSILRIIDGATFDDYRKYHPFDKYSYFDYIAPITNWNFGPDRLFGLKGNKSESPIQTKDDGQAGELHSCATGSVKTTLPLSFPQSGLYVLTLRTSGPAKAFRVGMDGKDIVNTKPIEANQCQTVTIPFYAKTTHSILFFDDTWKICSLAVQPLMYESEDFTFNRRLWRVKNIPTPSNFYCGSLQDTNFKADVQTFPWKASDPVAVMEKKPTLPSASECRFSPDNPNLLWRWNAKIGGLGPNNFGSFREFDNEKDLSRRLDDLKQKGFNVLLINGLHFRHIWPDQLDRMKEAIKKITEQAHKRGIKVFDHYSLSIIPNSDCGLSGMCRHIDWTQRDLRNGQVTRGWCPNNPDFRKHFFEYKKNLVKYTGIDGLMLDEVAFHKDFFCGCEHCRKKFHDMTGLDMPADETSPVFKDQSGYLWQLWLEFRARSIGDFKVAMQNAVKEVNPDFIQINYTTHWGLLSGISFSRSGGDMTQVARSSNMLGTEIMSRNVFECYRQVYACRTLVNSLRWTFNVPIFGLVYHLDEPVFAYTGWAMNNMHGQSTWYFSEAKSLSNDCAKYVNWKDNMQTWRARPQADVAVLFSQSSRNHPGGNSQDHELLGTCEILGDLHIQYCVRMNIGLTQEELKQYKLVIVPSCANMSDADYDVIRTYMEQGGNVLAMYHSGANDELGFRRDTWPLGNWLGIDRIGKHTVTGATWNGIPLKGRVFKIQVNDKDTAVLQKLQIAGKEYPAVVQKKIGNGCLTYSPTSLAKDNVQSFIMNNETWKWSPNPNINELYRSLLQTSLRTPPAFTSSSDSRVRMKLWKYADQPVWMLHVLNCTGASMKPEQTLTGTPPRNPYPALQDDIHFTINPGKQFETSNITAYWVSPDMEEENRVPLDVVKKGKRVISVTIPRNLIKTYGIAYIEAK